MTDDQTRKDIEWLHRAVRLAIAHDRQLYPTAWAYERACERLRESKAWRETAEPVVAAARACAEWWEEHVGRDRDGVAQVQLDLLDAVRAHNEAQGKRPPALSREERDKRNVQGPLGGVESKPSTSQAQKPEPDDVIYRCRKCGLSISDRDEGILADIGATFSNYCWPDQGVDHDWQRGTFTPEENDEHSA